MAECLSLNQINLNQLNLYFFKDVVADESCWLKFYKPVRVLWL